MKLTNILQEVLSELNVPKPEDAYKFDQAKAQNSGHGKYYKYTWTNNQGNEMEATVMAIKHSKDPGKTFTIAFGPHNKEDFFGDEESEEDMDKRYATKTGAGDLIKVLATVVEAVKQTAKKEGGLNKVYKMEWAPSDAKRKNIYDHYVQTLFPSFKKDPSSRYWQSYINKKLKKPKEEEQ